MFPGLHPTALMSTAGIGGMIASGSGGGNSFHHGGGAANHMGPSGSINNHHQQPGVGNRPGHMPLGVNTHGSGHQVGHNQGFGGPHGFASFNGGGPHHPNPPGGGTGPGNHGLGIVGHPHGHQVNPAISKANAGMGGHGPSNFNINDPHMSNPQAAAMAAAASAMGGLHIGPGAANGGNIGGGSQISSVLQQETSYLHIPNTSVGAVIGTKGSHIRNIIKFSGANVKIASNSEAEKATIGSETISSDGIPSPSDRRVTIIGSPESQWKVHVLLALMVFL